jgi:Zn-finger nucleic acid-binding protein
MLTSPQVIQCPDHKIPLVVRSNGWPRFRCCPQCLGFWFNKADLSYLHLSEEKLKEKRLFDLGFKSKSLRICPQCSSSMLVKNAKGVEIDVCTACSGIWLDAGELYKLSEIKHQSFKVKEYDSSSGLGLKDGFEMIAGIGDVCEIGFHGIQLIIEVLGCLH